jgi:hypothetical protein
MFWLKKGRCIWNRVVHGVHLFSSSFLLFGKNNNQVTMALTSGSAPCCAKRPLALTSILRAILPIQRVESQVHTTKRQCGWDLNQSFCARHPCPAPPCVLTVVCVRSGARQSAGHPWGSKMHSVSSVSSQSVRIKAPPHTVVVKWLKILGTWYEVPENQH